jgi:hypothetical protein
MLIPKISLDAITFKINLMTFQYQARGGDDMIVPKQWLWMVGEGDQIERCE